jgi:hypothetical protein
MAVPLFIFAATICRFIEDPAWCNPAAQLQKLLDYQVKFQNSDFDRLDSTYLPILDQIVVGKVGSARACLIERFKSIVGAIVLLAEPLSALALSRILHVPLSAIQGQLKTLHSVLTVPASANAPIRTIHLSFRDFLVDPSKKDTIEFWVDDRATHARLATRCVDLLSTETLKEDICNLMKPGIPLSQVDQHTINTCLPLEVQYACLYWTYHLECGNVSIQDGDQVHSFLIAHFLHWLEALCFLGKIRQSITALHSLRKLIQVSQLRSVPYRRVLIS